MNIIDDMIVKKAAGDIATGKADKVANAVNGNLAGLDSTGNLTDSGKSPSAFAEKGTLTSATVVGVNADGKVESTAFLSAGETWTFTLTGGTTVTKKVLCATVTEYAPPVLEETTAPAWFFDDYGSEWDDRKDGESGLLSED